MNSKYTIPVKANKSYIQPMTQQSSLVSGTTSDVSVPTSPYDMSLVIQQPTAPLDTLSTNQ